jgi:hypothetical protein
MTSFDMSDTIAPKSDQLDAVDLLGGDRTFTIERISRNNDEQPFNFHLAGFPRPWRPNLSMRRVLMSCWGPDAATYVGRRVTLYCDPDVEFGGAAVGGTRIRALSHIDKPKQVPLLVKRGKSKVYTVQPLADAPAPTQTADGITDEQMKALGPLLKAAGLTDRGQTLAYVSSVIDRSVGSSKELTKTEAAEVIAQLEQDTAREPAVPPPGGDWPETATIPGTDADQ